MKNWLNHFFSGFLLIALVVAFAVHGQEAERKPNVLLIMIDDLRPVIGAYGDPLVHTPNIDKLAASGYVFQNAFTTVPVCGASRAAIMAGRKPTTNRFLTYNSRLDVDMPEVTTLPEHFKNNGYVTLGNGKLFDVMTDSPQSWSSPVWRPQGDWSSSVPIDDRGEDLQKAYINPLASVPGPAFERLDVEDNAYPDGLIAEKTIADIERFAESGESFFLAMGIRKPHLPFNAPEKYWSLYDAEDFRLPSTYVEKPATIPANPFHSWGELRQYSGIPDQGPLTNDEQALNLIHGYYAAVSYADALVGKVLDTLERESLADNTIVMLIGDHGFNLGEHTMWTKHTLFDLALQAPMIVRAPGYGTGRINGVTDFLDIYPTLIDLAALPMVAELDGVSLVPALEDPSVTSKEVAVSKWFDGTSVRTPQYRYTEWRTEENEISARMLFDVINDPDETLNLAEQTDYEQLVTRFNELITADNSNAPWSQSVRNRVAQSNLNL